MVVKENDKLFLKKISVDIHDLYYILTYILLIYLYELFIWYT